MKFKCNGCGCCCKKVNLAVEATKHIDKLHFPYKWDDDGVCEKLDINNNCMVYDERPLICNVEKFAEEFNLDKAVFYEQNYRACDKLINDNILNK